MYDGRIQLLFVLHRKPSIRFANFDDLHTNLRGHRAQNAHRTIGRVQFIYPHLSRAHLESRASLWDAAAEVRMCWRFPNVFFSIDRTTARFDKYIYIYAYVYITFVLNNWLRRDYCVCGIIQGSCVCLFLWHYIDRRVAAWM